MKLVGRAGLHKKGSPFKIAKYILKELLNWEKMGKFVFKSYSRASISPKLALIKYCDRQFRCWLVMNLFWVLISYFPYHMIYLFWQFIFNAFELQKD